MARVNPSLKTVGRLQRTIKQDAFFSGIGIHTGHEVSLRFCPAPEDTGVIFRRVDLPGQPTIPATVGYVIDTSRSTTIGTQNAKIHTVEHVLSAVKAYQIDNLYIEINSIEPPVGNGSADIFVNMLEKAGIDEQKKFTSIIKVNQPIYYSDDHIQIVALPCDHYKISYTLSYPGQKFLKEQFYTLTVNQTNFKNDIAPCRTFSLYKELSTLMDRGLIKGGSLDNAVVITDEAILSKGGLFFENEMVRHKILDLVGDLSLVGFDFHAHIISIRSGHASNFAFAKKLLAHITMENH